MIILHMRYNSGTGGGAFCLPTALQNVTQCPNITCGTSIGLINGLHPGNQQNEDNFMEGCDLTNAIVVLVNSEFAAGTPGHYVAKQTVTIGGESIGEGDPVFLSYGVGQGDEFNAYINRVTVAPVLQNSFFFIYSSVQTPYNDAPINHWLSSLKRGDFWYITGGEMGSKLIEIHDRHLMDVLFTRNGRNKLIAAVAEAWPEFTSIEFVENYFLHIPKIQLRSAKSWDGVTEATIKNSSPWTVIPRRNTNSRRWHTVQIVDTIGRGRADQIKNLDMEA